MHARQNQGQRSGYPLFRNFYYLFSLNSCFISDWRSRLIISLTACNLSVSVLFINSEQYP